MNENQNTETKEQETETQLEAIQTPIINSAQENIPETSKDFVNISNDSQEAIEDTEKLPHLRPRLVKFCEAKLSGKTDAEAIDLAGFKCKNDNVKRVQAHRLLSVAMVRTYLDIRGHQETLKL
jgi:hypothetical protein